MKRFLVIICIITTIIFAKSNTQAGDYSTITANPTISASINALDRIGKTDVIRILQGQNATGRPIRVMFRNLAIYGAANCEAFTTKTKAGTLVIYINEKHKDAPLEAIACLIAHESQHHTMTNTKAEELKGWLKEVSTWNAFVRADRTVAYSNHSLVKRENYIARLYVRDKGQSGIEKIIAANPVYKGLN